MRGKCRQADGKRQRKRDGARTKNSGFHGSINQQNALTGFPASA